MRHGSAAHSWHGCTRAAGGSLEAVTSGSSIAPTWLLTVMRPRVGARPSAATMCSCPDTDVRAPADRNSLQAPPTPASTRCCGTEGRGGQGRGMKRVGGLAGVQQANRTGAC